MEVRATCRAGIAEISVADSGIGTLYIQTAKAEPQGSVFDVLNSSRR